MRLPGPLDQLRLLRGDGARIDAHLLSPECRLQVNQRLVYLLE